MVTSECQMFRELTDEHVVGRRPSPCAIVVARICRGKTNWAMARMAG
jgi:hypothetical protein